MMESLINKPINADCFDIFEKIQPKSVDFIFCDLPYGSTNCSWDSALPLNHHIDGMGRDEFFLQMFKSGFDYKQTLATWNKNKKFGIWQHYNRIIKDDGIIVLYAQTPFDKVLGESNLQMLRYEWIWEKTQATGHLNSKRMPMKAHENLLVFYKNKPSKVKGKDFNRTYNYIKTYGHERKVASAKNRGACAERRNGTDDIYNDENPENIPDYDSTERYPRTVLKFKSDKQTSAIHKTQKPMALTEYMVKTYSNPGDLVLDNCAGSFVVAEACNNLDRNWICIEKDTKIFNEAIQERNLC